MKLNARFWMPLVVIAVAAGPAGADVSLSSVLDKALQRSPDLKGARAQMDAAKGEVRETRALRYPRLNLRTQVTRGDNPVYVFGSRLEQQAFGAQHFAIDSLNNPGSLTNIKNAVDLGVPLFAGFEISNGEKIRRLMLERAQKQYEGADQETRYRVVEAYLSALKEQENFRLLSERVAASEEEVEDARRLNARGLVLGSDFYAAQAVLSALKARRAQAEKKSEMARDLLSVLTGEPLDQAGPLRGRLSGPVYTVARDNDPVQTALQARTDLKDARLQASASDLLYRQSRRSLLPKIEAFASLETNTEDFDSNPSNHTIGVRSNIPIGDPAYFARRSKAESTAHWADSHRESVEDRIRMDVVQAVKAYQAAQASLPLLEKTVEESGASLRLFRPLYKEGRQSILDVLKAEEALASAREALNENEFQIHQGYARLHLATGQFGPATVEAIRSNLEKAP